MRRSLSFYPFILIFIFSISSQSEPWISNRFAQNCAGCHAPGRFNLPAKKRRCTLSCQGCHVNPNGGGLRNEYGKWNQQRWLKTFRIKHNKFDKNAPAPDFAQSYMQESKTLKFKRKGKGKKKNKHKGKGKKKRKLVKKNLRSIPKVYTTNALSHEEHYYNQFSNKDWKINAKSMKQFLSRIPQSDPYRLERSKLFTGGADLRYFYGSLSFSDNDPPVGREDFDLNVLMGVDLGLRIKPIKEHLSLVFETRFSTFPQAETGTANSFKSSKLRSAYVLSDNHIYNTWVMAGFYRPHFGLYTPDHESLSSRLTGMDQSSTYNAIGVGAAPNVPFINAHMIFKKGFQGDTAPA